MIQVKNVTFSYDKKKPAIYQNLNLEFQDNDSIAILGFNGAGKSTLMKLLLGILHPTHGTIMVDGMNIHKKRIAAMHHIGVVWGQKPSLWWDISAKRSYDTLAKMYHLSDIEYQETLMYLDKQLQVSEFWHQPLRSLSLGQRVKAEMIGALLHRPSLLILDEPFIGLDFLTREKVINVLNAYRNHYPCTLLLTSHHIDDVKELCKHMTLIDHGEIIYDGCITKLMETFPYQKEIVLTHTMKEFKIQDIYCDYLDVINLDEHKIKLMVKSKEIDHIELMKSLLKDNQIIDFKINSVSLELVIKMLIHA